MQIKILGMGCPSCRSMFNEVNKIVTRNKIEADVEYVQDIERIMAYGVMSTPALVINDKVVMVGFRGATKIEEAIRKAG